MSKRFKGDLRAVAQRVKVGDVLVATWGSTKGRPWVVLWIDLEENLACVCALTQQDEYVCAIPVDHAKFKTAATWAQVQPFDLVERQRVVGRMNTAQRAAIRKALRENLDLED